MPDSTAYKSCYDKVVKYKITAECKEPFHVGGGGEDGEILVHPVDNMPFLQATGIAGAFREYFSYDRHLQEELFGNAGNSEDDGAISKVFFSDGIFRSASLYTELRPRIRINPETGTCLNQETKGNSIKSGQKFETEVLSSGSVFEFEIYLYEKQENYENALEESLAALHRGEIQLGGQKSNGCGYAVLLSVKKAEYHLTDKSDRILWRDESKEMKEILEDICENIKREDERMHFALEGITDGGLLIKAVAVTEYGENAPDAVNIRNGKKKYIIPASSVKGAVRAQMERIARYRDMGEQIIQEAFGTAGNEEHLPIPGEIYFYDCEIGSAEDNDKVPVQRRIHIDKFTGGVMPQHLFSEKPAYGDIRICVDTKRDNDAQKGLLLMALRDFGLGLVPFGSGRSIGRGYLRGRRLQLFRGQELIVNIDLETGKILKGEDTVKRYLLAVEKYLVQEEN